MCQGKGPPILVGRFLGTIGRVFIGWLFELIFGVVMRGACGLFGDYRNSGKLFQLLLVVVG